MTEIPILIIFIACSVSANLIINEVNSSPISSNCEWIEIYNNSDSTIYIDSLSLSNGNSVALLSENVITLKGSQFLVLVQDSLKFNSSYHSSVNTLICNKWVAIYNDEGSVVISDTRGVIDSVYYDNSWFDKLENRSINRINTDNATEIDDWEVAKVSSPGYPNSKPSNSAFSFRVSPFPFTPDNDGIDDYLIISVDNSNSEEFVVVIVGLNGEVYKEYSGSGSGEFSWNGEREQGGRSPIGPFYIIARVGSNEYRSKGLLWRN